MNTHDHDDGLVHGHAWASEPPRPGRLPIRQTPPTTAKPEEEPNPPQAAADRPTTAH